MKVYSPTLRKTLLIALVSFVAMGAKTLNRSVAVVNNEVILESDIDKFQARLRSKSYRELFGQVDERALKSREAALQVLIEEKLINQQVKKLELGASDAEIDGQIRAITKRNGITPAQLNERLKQLGTTLNDYRDSIRRQIERRNLVDREIRPNLELSDEQLRHYYNRNAGSEDGETQFKIAHILVSNTTKNGVAGADRAKQIWKDLSAHPENFDAAAKDYSDDRDTAASGGVLGFFTLSQLNKEFRAAVPKTPIGKVTAPIKTTAGYHIVKVLESRAGDFANLPKERKEALRNQMMGEELEKKMGMWLERKRAEAYIRITLNKEAAKPEKKDDAEKDNENATE